MIHYVRHFSQRYPSRGIKFVMELEKCPICNVYLDVISDTEVFDGAGFTKDGFNKSGYDTEGYDEKGFDREGGNRTGYSKAGFDEKWFNKQGIHRYTGENLILEYGQRRL